MKRINELDRATLKNEFKNMYTDIGCEGCLQVLYELLVSVNVLIEVINEKAKEEKEMEQ